MNMTTENSLPLPPNHFLITALLVAIAIGVTWYITKRGSDERVVAAIQNTVSAEMKKYGISTQSTGTVTDYAGIEKRLRDTMGKELLAEIRKTGSAISSVSTAVGEVKGEVRSIKREGISIELPQTPDNSFSAVKLSQNRENLPPLTSISLDYKNNKLSGTWTNNTEDLIISNSVWKTSEDGIRSAITAKRIVYLGQDKTNKIGEEDIPIIQNNISVPLSEIQRLAPIPKYSVFLGGSVDSKTGEKHLGGFVTTHVTRQIGITGGYINNGALLGVSYTFGKK